jgi:hypothetical protein
VDKHSNLTRAGSLCVGVAAAIVLAALSVINLESQGAHYDELHQAPAAFNYLGKQSPTFNYDFHGIPILNMTYSGAIKSNIYGLYLKYVTPKFTIYSWRLLGIVFLAIGLIGFYQIAGVSLSVRNAVLFGALLLTDASIILTNRHDFGPVALALCFRLGFLAVWMSIELRKPASWKFFIAGSVVGIAIFEKLSSFVLLIPLCFLLLTVRRRTADVWIAAATGLLTGSLPLLLVNIGQYARGYGFISLSDLSAGPVDRLNVLGYAYEYLALGQGDMASRLILGEFSNPFWKQAEALFMGTMLLIIVVAGLRLRPLDRSMTLAALIVSAYVTIGIAVYMLPRITFVHHWILGTPFQYGAIALALAGFASSGQREKERLIYKVLFMAVVIALLAIRIPNTVGVEVSLASGKASQRFHPAYTRLGEIAAARSNDAAFIAADWGTATQVYCLGDGQADLIYEPFWDSEPIKTVVEIAATTRKNTLYTLTTGIAPEFRQASSSILLSMTTLADWQEVPVEKELLELPPIQVRKFVRRTNR